MTADSVGVLGSNTKGLPALEHLLFTGAPTPRRCAYAAELSRSIAVIADDTVAGWDIGLKRFLLTQRLLDDTVSVLADAAHRLADENLAMPAGARAIAPGAPDPALVRGAGGKMAGQDVQAQLAAITAGYEVTVAPILRGRDPGAHASVTAALGAAAQAVAAVPDDLATAVTRPAERTRIVAAAEACRNIQRVLATQVVSVLGLTLYFLSTDGD